MVWKLVASTVDLWVVELVACLVEWLVGLLVGSLADEKVVYWAVNSVVLSVDHLVESWVFEKVDHWE